MITEEQAPGRKVGIVILNYNGGDLLLECVQSFLTLQGGEYEIIIVDNASVDDSGFRCKRAFPSIHLLRQESNSGYTGGNNKGIEKALDLGADYVLVVNPDTIVINPRFVCALIDCMERDPAVGIAGPKVYFQKHGVVQNTICPQYSGVRHILQYIRCKLFGRKLLADDTARYAPLLNGVCILLRRKTIEEVGLYDVPVFMYGDDWDYTWRMNRAGWKSFYCPVESIVHLQKASGYDYCSMVNFLLKRNAFYVRLKHGQRGDAFYHMATALLVSWWRMVLHFPTREREKYRRFFKLLTRSMWAAWKGHYDSSAFGPPNISWAEMNAPKPEKNKK